MEPDEGDVAEDVQRGRHRYNGATGADAVMLPHIQAELEQTRKFLGLDQSDPGQAEIDAGDVGRELLRRMHAGEMYPTRPIDDARRALLRLLLLRPSASTPERRCNGGPWALDWCGRTATFVGNEDGLEYFACDDHAGGARVPIAAWFKKLERPA